ncbi:hypothetical protein CERSUDRAFT_118352 [Gelatoporia subvermispora B]|uniref:Uncharacterized protein n=1 Tax=Ceriporiopsis subvermispora (strain B) TaxID=914234 RepID=M2Q7Z5_CERS8|nr:hypothetical protein CERSUDRAFT_118352 [Gelatoporia subvermispora B]
MPTTIFKGKDTRSWQQLPPEIIRLITTYCILDASMSNFCPAGWEYREAWPSRLVYTTVRDAQEVERLMYICPAWAAALEDHLFWQQACAVIDPNDFMAHTAFIKPSATAGSTNAQMVKLSPYQHFRNITNCSCIVCRINAPYSSTGLAHGKRLVPTPWLGNVVTCREHRKATYCGVCMRAAPQAELEGEGGIVCCAENEDEETWPGVEATCRLCRQEWLWTRVQHNPVDREALGGPKWQSKDWETRQGVDAFLDLGEGTIADVIVTAREKHWLRSQTKLPELLQQALASSRYSRAEAGEGYGTDEELSEEEDEEDPEVLSMTEDAGGVKELAIQDWARNRILDGYWVSPADQWYGFANTSRPLVPSVHPCPWNRGATYSGAVDDGETEGDGAELDHPRPRTVGAPPPPTYQLCEHTYRAYIKQMHDILLPAMRNIVRRIAIECSADGADPTIRASRMTTEEVLRELHHESTWFNGIDWLERRANERELERKRQRERKRGKGKEKDEDESSSSSRSEGSHTTSPVLSTTTLQTTPSPPPSGEAKEDETVVSPTTSVAPTLSIAVSPVLKSPELIHPIPYIPVALSQMPQYGLDAFTQVWREACAPLYQCRCSVCERAVLKANIAAGNILLSQVQPQRPAPQVAVPQPPVQIKIQEAPVPLPVEEEEESGESERGDDTSVPDSVADVPEVPVATPTKSSRKRSSEELDADAYSDAVASDGEAIEFPRTASPPKRARTDSDYSPKYSPAAVELCPAPTRLRKRSSEELDDPEGGRCGQAGNGDAKRLRADPSQPRSTLAPAAEIKTSSRVGVDTKG